MNNTIKIDIPMVPQKPPPKSSPRLPIIQPTPRSSGTIVHMKNNGVFMIVITLLILYVILRN